MPMISRVNCIGLPIALTVLRIKQALVIATEKPVKPIKVAVGDCDRKQLMTCLGPLAKAVQFV